MQSEPHTTKLAMRIIKKITDDTQLNNKQFEESARVFFRRYPAFASQVVKSYSTDTEHVDVQFQNEFATQILSHLYKNSKQKNPP